MKIIFHGDGTNTSDVKQVSALRNLGVQLPLENVIQIKWEVNHNYHHSQNETGVIEVVGPLNVV